MHIYISTHVLWNYVCEWNVYTFLYMTSLRIGSLNKQKSWPKLSKSSLVKLGSLSSSATKKESLLDKIQHHPVNNHGTNTVLYITSEYIYISMKNSDLSQRFPGFKTRSSSPLSVSAEFFQRKASMVTIIRSLVPSARGGWFASEILGDQICQSSGSWRCQSSWDVSAFCGFLWFLLKKMCVCVVVFLMVSSQ